MERVISLFFKNIFISPRYANASGNEKVLDILNKRETINFE